MAVHPRRIFAISDCSISSNLILIDDLQSLPGGIGICADDIVAGVYAGVCLAVGYAIYLSV